MSEQMPCFWGTSSSIAMNSSTLNPEAALANVEIVTKDKVVARVEDDDINGDLRRVEDQFVDDLLVDQNNVDEESLLLPDDSLFQLLSELEIQKYALPPCIVDEPLLDGVHLPIEEVKLLEKGDRVDKSKGKELVKETEQRRSPSNDHHHKATKKISKKRNRDQRSKRRQIDEKLQALQKLIPKSDNKRDYASILNNVIDHIKFMKHQIEMMLTWRGMRHFQQAAYIPTTYIPMMMRPNVNVQLGAATMTPSAIAGAQPMPQMPTITPMLYPLPPIATTSFAPPVFLPTTPGAISRPS